MKHYTLFILIQPGLERMGHDLSRGNITATHLKEEMNIEFGISVVSNFLVPRSGPVGYQKPFYGLSSHRGHFLRLQKSHLRK